MMIRPARVPDADDIAAAHVASWQQAYRGIFPDERLDSIDIAARARSWAGILADDVAGVIVAEIAGAVVGFASAGASRDDDADPTTGEVWGIYLHPDAWGIGMGRQLMAAAITLLVEAGYDDATLWVLAANERAIRFYAAAGWTPDGRIQDIRALETTVAETRFRRVLRPRR